MEGVRAVIARHIGLAQALQAWIAATPDFELLAPRSLSLLNFRCHPAHVDDAQALDRLNERLLEALNDSGRLYVTPNRVRGVSAIRLAIGQTTTGQRHVEAAWRMIQSTARALGA